MKLLLRWITESFITVFGITRPRDGEEDRAGVFIVVLLLGVLFVMVATTYILLRLW